MELIVSIYVWKTELDRRNLRSEMERIQKKGKQHDNVDTCDISDHRQKLAGW